MRQTFAKYLYDFLKKNPDAYFLTADLGMYIFDDVMKLPNAINTGASEQAMLDIAIGLAYDGKKVVCYSITPFLLYRPFEAIRTYLNHEKLPVLLVGSGRDDDYKHDGFSHYAGDDSDILGQLKNIEIYKPKDNEELAEIMPTLLKFNKPSYLNLSKQGRVENMARPKNVNPLPDIRKGEQLSNQKIKEKIRIYVPSLIEKAVSIANNGDNDNAKLGAIKLLLSKCLPDLKSTELDLGEQTKFIIQLVKEVPLNDRKEDTTTNKELPKSADNI